MSCPNSTESGCRCVEHHPGLAEYAVTNPEGLDRALARVRRTQTLRIVTMPRDDMHDPHTCDRMVCDHPRCIAVNANRQPQGSGNADPFRRAA